MKVHTIVRSIVILLLGTLASWAAHASNITVTLYLVDNSTTPATVTQIGNPLTGAGVVNLDADPGQPVATYGPFTITRCLGCAGRARIFVSEGSIDKFVFTDAQITNTSGGPASLQIVASSGLLSVSGPAGDYPYAVELSGTFTAPLGAGLATDPINHIDVTATTNANCDGDCVIDNPVLDPGEIDNGFGFPSPNRYSLVAPPFLGAGAASYAPKEQQIFTCNNVFNPDTGSSNLCQPALTLIVNLTLKSRHAARLPGSIGAFHVPTRCDPDSGDPALLKGCTIMADFFASLGPKGFKVYDVRLEPSPGTQLVDFRFGTPNSTAAWVSRRGGDDDDDDGGDGNVSKTRVRLMSNGSGEVRASGLCPASGCPSSNVLPVHVYCGQNARPVGDTALQLNARGDGRVTLSFGVPCVDPAVLIMDPSDASWVAAPAIL